MTEKHLWKRAILVNVQTKLIIYFYLIITILGDAITKYIHN